MQRQAQMAPSQDEEEILLTLSLRWSWFDKPEGQKRNLERYLQTWFNKRKAKVNCSVERTEGDGSFVIKMKPLPALSDLQKLTGETLTTRGGKAKATILSVSLGSPRLDAQTPDHVSANSLSVFDNRACPRKRSRRLSAVEPNSSLDDGVSEESCLVSVDHFGYINHVYKKEIKQIEKKNKSHMLVHVNVTFESDQTDGRPNEALSDFTQLVQKHSADSRDSVIPLKFVDPDQWSEALKVIQKKKNKLFLTLSSEEMVVRGPSQSKEAFSETLNATQKNTPSKETKPASQNTSLRPDTSNWDTVLNEEPLMEENYNKTSTKTKAKSDLDLKESSLKKTDNKSSDKNSDGIFSSLISTLISGATGLSGSLKNLTSDNQLNNIYRTPSSRKQAKQNSEASTGGGATSRVSRDEKCSICLDPFMNKKQLNCKHEFCEECLQKAVKHNGPICPICKDVFGVMVGDQPDGTMMWKRHPTSLPGFPGCGHILITYDIPSGKQTEKHPNPGEIYSGVIRTAYLPDNNEGEEVLKLLKKAFDQRLIFTVGTSRTTGLENQVVWNDISHKTSISGGSEGFGFPDSRYLSRVKEELKDKGIQHVLTPYSGIK